jgi:hypothetical protein
MNKKNPLVQKTTTAALTATLQAIKGAKIATIVTETTPELLKRGNPFKGVVKKTTMNVLINFNYRKALDKALVAGGVNPTNRPAGKRPWGEKVPNSPFIMHKGHMYLEAKNNGRPSKVEWFIDGEAIAADKIAPFMPKRQEMDVPMCDVRIENIKELRTNGIVYVVE